METDANKNAGSNTKYCEYRIRCIHCGKLTEPADCHTPMVTAEWIARKLGIKPNAFRQRVWYALHKAKNPIMPRPVIRRNPYFKHSMDLYRMDEALIYISAYYGRKKLIFKLAKQVVNGQFDEAFATLEIMAMEYGMFGKESLFE